MDTPSTMIERLKLSMKKKNINQSKLAERLGVHFSTVSHWFHHREEVSPKHHRKICSILNISMSWLIDGIGPMEPIVVQNELEAMIVSLLRLQNAEVQDHLLFILKNWRPISQVVLGEKTIR